MSIKPLSTPVDISTPSTVSSASVVSVINTNATPVRIVVAEAVTASIWIAAGERVSIEKTPAVDISADDGTNPVTASTVFATKIAYGN
jgi:hypothetical protein